MLLHLERCSAPGKAGLRFADALAGKRSVQFVVTSIIPNLGHDRKRCQKSRADHTVARCQDATDQTGRRRTRCPSESPRERTGQAALQPTVPRQGFKNNETTNG